MVNFNQFMKTTVCWTCVIIIQVHVYLKWAFVVQAFLVLGLFGSGPFWQAFFGKVSAWKIFLNTEKDHVTVKNKRWHDAVVLAAHS